MYGLLNKSVNYEPAMYTAKAKSSLSALSSRGNISSSEERETRVMDRGLSVAEQEVMAMLWAQGNVQVSSTQSLPRWISDHFILSRRNAYPIHYRATTLHCPFKARDLTLSVLQPFQ